MALQLANQPGQLEAVASKLSRDTDIQSEVRKLATKGRNCVSAYNGMMTSEGNAVLAQKQLLIQTTTANDVAFSKMQSCLGALTTRLTTIRNDVQSMQGDVNCDIEACRKRKGEHESSVSSKQASISNLKGQISTCEEEIRTCESTAASNDQAAQELDNRAGEIESAARRKRKRGKWGFIGAAVGIVLAPVSGGASLALTAAGLAHGAVNTNDAGDCRRNAGRLRNEATARRQEVASINSRISTLRNEISSNQSQLSTLQTAIGNLNTACSNLQQMTNVLSEFLSTINGVLSNFQNMETSFKEVTLQTDSFVIIQKALSRNGTLTGKSQVYLDKLKDKWTAMESVLLTNGARPVLTQA